MSNALAQSTQLLLFFYTPGSIEPRG